MSKAQAEPFKRQSLHDLQQMYRAGQARPAAATNLNPGACYLCGDQFPVGEGRLWKLQGAISGVRVLCPGCDAEVRTRAPAAAEGDGE